MSEEELKRYEKYLINFIRDNDVLNTARMEGEMKGKMERNIEIAIEMILDGEENEKIKKYARLTDEQINELRNNLKINK
jgi:hypothetical protein